MSTLMERAIAYREKNERAAQYIPDEVIHEFADMLPKWDPNGHSYSVNDKFVYNDIVYMVTIAHISQPDWIPTDAHSLYSKVVRPSEPDEVVPWQQGTYMKGDKVSNRDHIWESVIDNNVWEPGSPGIDDRYWIMIE